MLDRLTETLISSWHEIKQTLHSREFWIYFAVIICMVALFVGLAYKAVGFDELTRTKFARAITCSTSEGQIGTIIVGGFAFALLCLFTLGEVAQWVEETRQAKAQGRASEANPWRPALHVAGTLAVGTVGFTLMNLWCQ